MEAVKFILGQVNAPPSHLGMDELERIYQEYTKPFLAALYKYRDVPLTLYFTGPYLEWLQKHHSEYLTVLTEMIRRKQIEVLGGGAFNPLLPLIPHADRIGQIEELTTTVRRTLGKRPRGCWISRGIWEPLLTTNLINTGMEFAFLDESSFRNTGIHRPFYPVITENQGKTLAVFPYSREWARQVLREGVPAFRRQLHERAGTEDSVLSLFLPGEYWAEDRESARWFFQEGGLDQLLQFFRESATELEGTHPGTYLKRTSVPLQKVYFNNSLVRDLWISGQPGLALKEISTDLRNYRQFLSDYPALGLLYGKMMYVHLLAYQIKRDKYKKKSALEDLWLAQSSSSLFLWKDQGAFLSPARKQAYGHLLQAEMKSRDKVTFTPSLGLLDIDLDGQKEVLYQGSQFNFYVDTAGGRLIEIDALKSSWNYADLFSFDPVKFQSEGGFSFADRFYLRFRHEDCLVSTPPDQGDFPLREYKIGELDRDQKTVAFTSRGRIRAGDGEHPVKIDKTYQFRENGLKVHYVLENLSPRDLDLVFVPEIRLSFKDPDAEKLFFTGHGHVRGIEGGYWQEWTDFQIHDKCFGQKIRLQADKPGRLSVAPESLDVQGSGRAYQGHRFLPQWDVQFRAQEVFTLSLELSFLPE